MGGRGSREAAGQTLQLWERPASLGTNNIVWLAMRAAAVASMRVAEREAWMAGKDLRGTGPRCLLCSTMQGLRAGAMVMDVLGDACLPV